MERKNFHLLYLIFTINVKSIILSTKLMIKAKRKVPSLLESWQRHWLINVCLLYE